MLAVDANYPEVVNLLLSYNNINLDLKNKAGASLMHLCVCSKEEVSYTFITEKVVWSERELLVSSL